MTRYATNNDRDELLGESEEDYKWSIIMDFRDRIRQLEATVKTFVARPTGAPTANPVVQQGEDVLAKAASAYTDPDSLMSLGEREISDPTTMGIFSSHLAANDLSAARDVLLDIRGRGHVAKAADAAQRVDQVFGGSNTESDVAAYDSRAATSELMARFGKLEQLMASLEARLSQLERRPQAAMGDDGQVMAKAAGPKRKRTKEEVEAQLYADLNAYIDSPTVTGQISSMIAGGQYKQVRQVLASAKRAHESEKIAAERRRF